MKRLTLAALALLVVAMNTQIADAASGRRSQGGPQRFYDESGQFRGYAWCRSRGGWTSMNPPDCSYYTQQQCESAGIAFSGNYCTPNPYSAQAGIPRRQR
jgi:hypothetical protein